MKVVQSCPTLCDPMDYTVHVILQGKILEWVAFPLSSRSSQPRNQTEVSGFAGRFFTNCAICGMLNIKFSALPDNVSWIFISENVATILIHLDYLFQHAYFTRKNMRPRERLPMLGIVPGT